MCMKADELASYLLCIHGESFPRTSQRYYVCPQDDDHDAEEWERYETFHDDVDKQVCSVWVVLTAWLI